jgi:hypothetical protein
VFVGVCFFNSFLVCKKNCLSVLLPKRTPLDCKLTRNSLLLSHTLL